MLTLTGVSSIDQGGTNNGSLSVTSGTIFYGDGTKIQDLAPGVSGQVLAMGAVFPEWINNSSSISITGSYTPTLAVRGGSGGSIPSQSGTGYYVKLPDQYLCFVRIDITFSTSSFGGGTVLDLELPFNMNTSGGRELGLNSYFKDSGGAEALKTCCFGLNYATFGQKNVFLNNPTSFIVSTGGWGLGTMSNLNIIVEGWYVIE